MSVKKGCISLRCYVEWSVFFFSESPKVDESWMSPTFQFSDATWFLRLYPSGHRSNGSERQICLYLVMQESEDSIRNVSFKLGVVAKDQLQYTPINCTHSYNNHEYSHGAIILERRDILRDRDFFPNGVVTFFCEAVVGEGENKVDAETRTYLQNGCSYLSRDLKELFLRQENADVKIKVKDKEFCAHSQILSARSAVFASMFRHDTKEKNTGVVEIPEFEPDAFREFLIFLYSGQTENLSSDNNIDLYSAADKYDIEELKTICSEFMKENITVDSFCDIFSLAIRYCDNDLIDFLTNYFVKNVKKIVVTLEWMSVVKEHPIESNELVIKLAQNIRS